MVLIRTTVVNSLSSRRRRRRRVMMRRRGDAGGDGLHRVTAIRLHLSLQSMPASSSGAHCFEMSGEAAVSSRSTDRLSPVALWMDSSDGKDDTSARQPPELTADFEMKELSVSARNNDVADPVSILGLESSETNDLAACRSALALAQRVSRTSFGIAALFTCPFA